MGSQSLLLTLEIPAQKRVLRRVIPGADIPGWNPFQAINTLYLNGEGRHPRNKTKSRAGTQPASTVQRPNTHVGGERVGVGTAGSGIGTKVVS